MNMSHTSALISFVHSTLVRDFDLQFSEKIKIDLHFESSSEL